MKIGYYVRYFPYKNRPLHSRLYTGPEVVAYNLAINMAKRGHEVEIFTISTDCKSSIEKYENITIYRYAKSFGIGHSNVSFGLFQKPLKHQVDIIHAHGSGIAGFAATQYPKRNHIPFVLTQHGDVPVGSYDKFSQRRCISFYKKYLIKRVLSSADVIISPSEYYISESRFLGEYRDKIVVVPNGINIEDFDVPYSKEECRKRIGLPINGNIILFVGTLTPAKGPDVLIKAMPRIIKEISDTKLVFVGSGRIEKTLEMLSRKLGINEHVKFAGFVGDTLKKASYYRAADIFVLPSIEPESFGIVNLEAMACGIPIVASKIGGIPDVVKDRKNGLLVPPKDSEALADAIIYLLENKDVREKIGKNARKKVGGYSWEKIAEETEKVYLSLIEQSRC
jgi:glycosyltransferase involved in cell wall biosynthesis